MGPDAFYIMIIVVTSIFAGVAVVRIVVDGIVRTKQAKHQIEREYLSQMMDEVREIKARLEALRSREAAGESVPH